MEAIMLIVFIIGYIAITLEHPLHINKAASAIITGVLCWTVFILHGHDYDHVNLELTEHIGEISGILFFLLGAMTIVELIDSHDGFEAITSRITTNNKRKLLWIMSLLTFFLSAVLDNLTTSIVMTSLSRKLISDKKDRMLFLGMVIISANAGGAWSPIGDVTTTMLWIGGQITTANIISKLFIPSIICALIPLIIVSFKISGNETPKTNFNPAEGSHAFERNLVLIAGISALIFVPIFKTNTHLPPYMGILLGLGVLWVITELLHRKKPADVKGRFTVMRALEKIDTSSILFFLGILVAVSSLQSAGMLREMAAWLETTIGNTNAIVITLGLLSSVIDNVPLVAAAMGMYDLSVYPTDHYFWVFLAYCCGTGGSALIIGSAAGVAVMGMEKIEFFWYLRNMTLYAVIGYFAGAITYILMEPLFM
jgi:Na+/H+ antiporter NhaD/arsenite permease-like protein